MNRFMSSLSLTEAILLLVLLANNLGVNSVEQPANGNPQQQPLGNLDKLLKQSSTGFKMDQLTDGAMASNFSKALTESLTNVRKVLEDKQVASQLQTMFQRMQNATGINSTSINNMQKQTPNITSLGSINFSNFMPRLN